MSFPLNWWSSIHGVATLYNCSVFLLASSQYLCMLMTTRQILREVSPTQAFFQLLQQKFVIRTFFCPPQRPFRSACMVHPKIHVSKNDCWFSKIDQFHQFLPVRIGILFPSSHFLCNPRLPIGTDLAFDARISVPSSVRFPIQSTRTFSNFLKLSFPQEANKWCPYKFRSRGTTGSSMCLGRRNHVSVHSDFGLLSNFGASSILTWA